jgi:hypothetical protein
MPNIWADNRNDNDDPNPRQLSDLRTCTIQEENIQGRTIIGTILADVCRGTQHSEAILGLQDNDVLSGEAGDQVIKDKITIPTLWRCPQLNLFS